MSEFEVEGKRIVLVDTSGFENTKRSDVEVLKPVAAFLEELCVKTQASGHFLEHVDAGLCLSPIRF